MVILRTGREPFFKNINHLKSHAIQWNVLHYKTPELDSGTTDVESTHRTRSLSPSPPRVHCPLQGQLENAMAEALSLDDGRQTNLTASGQSRRGQLRHRLSHRKHSKVNSPFFFLEWSEIVTFYICIYFFKYTDTSVRVSYIRSCQHITFIVFRNEFLHIDNLL